MTAHHGCISSFFTSALFSIASYAGAGIAREEMSACPSQYKFLAMSLTIMAWGIASFAGLEPPLGITNYSICLQKLSISTNTVKNVVD